MRTLPLSGRGRDFFLFRFLAVGHIGAGANLSADGAVGFEHGN